MNWSRAERAFRSPLGLGAGIVVLTAAVYGQVLRHDFVNFDDEQYVTAEPMVQAGVTLEGIRWALTDVSASNWFPLTRISHMIDCELFGVSAGPHLFVNLLLHLGNTLLLLALLYRATGAAGPSAFVAAVFALHPLHVESVAWISERKDVLSTFFALVALNYYVAYVQAPSRMRYFGSLAAFACALMSKSMVVTIPCVFLLLDAWPLKRYGRVALEALLVEKIPFFVLVAVVCIVTVVAQSQGGAVATAEHIPLATRLTHAPIAYMTYLGKAFFPAGLAAFYPYPEAYPGFVKIAGSAVALIAISATAIGLVRRAPYVFTGWFWFVGMLVPVIGIVQVGSQALADRYTYLSLTGVAIVVAWGVRDLMAPVRWRSVALGTAGVLISVVLAFVTAYQVDLWRDSATLWTHAIDVTGGSSTAHNNLGTALYDQGRYAEAEAQFRQALAFSDTNWEARNNLGAALLALGEPEEALREFDAVSSARPEDASVHLNAAVALMRLGQRERALARARRALEVDPGYEKAADFLEMHRAAV